MNEGGIYQAATRLHVRRILAERPGVVVDHLILPQAFVVQTPFRLEVALEEGPGRAWQACNV
jgi:hypothetical protein